MTLEQVKEAAEKRRKLRWAKEKAADKERAAHREMAGVIARWRGTAADQLTFSNIACMKAPADLGCVFVASSNPYRNPCVFCGHFERDVF